MRYQFTDWSGGFTCDTAPLDEFLEETGDRLCYLQHLEKRFKKLRVVSVGIVSAVTFLLLAWLLVAWLPGFLALPATMGALVLALSLDRWISRRLRRMPHRIIDDGRLEGVGGRIRALQRQLAEIRGDRPNPLRTKKLGKAILAATSPPS